MGRQSGFLRADLAPWCALCADLFARSYEDLAGAFVSMIATAAERCNPARAYL